MFSPLKMTRSVLASIDEMVERAGALECMGLLASARGQEAVTDAELLPARASRASAEASPLDVKRAVDSLTKRELIARGIWHSHGHLDVFHSDTDHCTIQRLLPAMAGDNFERDVVVCAPVIQGPDAAVLPLSDGRQLWFSLEGAPIPGTDLQETSCWTRIDVRYELGGAAPAATVRDDRLELAGGGVVMSLGVPAGAALRSRVRDPSRMRLAQLYSLVVNTKRQRYAQCLVFIDVPGESITRLGDCAVVETDGASERCRAMIDRFDRQRRIPGWDQDRLQAGRVAVFGRDWTGTFTVWGLASLGIGQILWAGAPRPSTDSMARWFLARPSPFAPAEIFDYPIDVEYDADIDWIFAGDPAGVLVCCDGDRTVAPICARYADAHRTVFLTGASSGGGFVGAQAPSTLQSVGGDPAVAMIVAALLVDAVRERFVPLAGGRIPAGPLALCPPPPRAPGSWTIAGVGGIGTYAAVVGAALGARIHVIDSDRVETTNLNRQGLFSPADAEASAFKAEAAARALAALFPDVAVSTSAAHVDERSALAVLRGAPLILSCLDNAAGRLALQSAARRAGATLVHAGTDVLAADCFTQTDGALLDEQMHGALSAALHAEDGRRDRAGGCAAAPSYVVPGMMAAGLMAYRARQASELYRGLTPIRWRAGELPIEGGNSHHDIDFSAAHFR